MEKQCLYCKEKYETNHSNSKYCTLKCGELDRKNREDYNQNESKTIRDWSKKLRAYDLFDNKCSKCGDNNMYHFVFHHKDPKIKDNNLSNIWQSSWTNIKKELDKCIMLCENCHKELHYTKNIKDYRHRITKDIYLNYKGNKCEKCGYDKCISALVFHHGNEKQFTIGENKKRIKSLDELTIELQKELNNTNLLCANCHREEHSTHLNDIWDKILQKKKTYKEASKKIDVEKVKKLHLENKSSKEISKLLNCSSSGVRNVLKRLRENESKNIINESNI